MPSLDGVLAWVTWIGFGVKDRNNLFAASLSSFLTFTVSWAGVSPRAWSLVFPVGTRVGVSVVVCWWSC